MYRLDLDDNIKQSTKSWSWLITPVRNTTGICGQISYSWCLQSIRQSLAWLETEPNSYSPAMVQLVHTLISVKEASKCEFGRTGLKGRCTGRYYNVQYSSRHFHRRYCKTGHSLGENYPSDIGQPHWNSIVIAVTRLSDCEIPARHRKTRRIVC